MNFIVKGKDEESTDSAKNYKVKKNIDEKILLPEMEISVKNDTKAKSLSVSSEQQYYKKDKTKKTQEEITSLDVVYNKASGKTNVKLIKAGAAISKAKSFVIYAAAFAITFLLVFGTMSQINMRLRFANEVIIDGRSVGYVSDKRELSNILERVDADTRAFFGNNHEINRQITYIPRIMATSDITSKHNLEDNIRSSNTETVYAHVLSINGKALFAAYDVKDIEDAIEFVKQDYIVKNDGDPNEIVEFIDKITIEKDYTTLANIRSIDSMISDLTATKEGEQVYYVGENDTLWEIARTNDLTIDDIMELNQDLTDIIHEGDPIVLKKSVPQYSIVSTLSHTVEKDIPYDVEKIQESSMFEGTTEVVEPGSLGKKRVSETIEKRDGQIVNVIVHSEEMLEEPVREVIRVGTKPVPKKGNGIFSRPLAGTITSRYGRRSSGQHTGLDIAASTGSSIKAADSGVVVFSGWSGGYGNLVKIDHRNGYVTYYAHCSKLLVSYGQEISAGQQIAKVGSTGNSTGPHLHFEVRKNGQPQDPSNYLN